MDRRPLLLNRSVIHSFSHSPREDDIKKSNYTLSSSFNLGVNKKNGYFGNGNTNVVKYDTEKWILESINQCLI